MLRIWHPYIHLWSDKFENEGDSVQSHHITHLNDRRYVSIAHNRVRQWQVWGPVERTMKNSFTHHEQHLRKAMHTHDNVITNHQAFSFHWHSSIMCYAQMLSAAITLCSLLFKYYKATHICWAANSEKEKIPGWSLLMGYQVDLLTDLLLTVSHFWVFIQFNTVIATLHQLAGA